MADNLAELIAAEETKRNQHVPRQERRRMDELALKRLAEESLQGRNTKEACLAKQARILAGMKAAEERK